jgi:hypothetical protein
MNPTFTFYHHTRLPKINMKIFVNVLIILSSILLLNSCQTGVEASPEPGIFRVTIVANEADSILVLLGDTARCSKYDRYDVILSNGRLYRGENYTDIFVAPTIDRIIADTVNLLQRQWNDGKLVGSGTDPFEIPRYQTKPVTYTVFEWYTPPGTYDKFQFGLKGIEVYVVIPRQFHNTMQLAEGVSLIMNLTHPVTINPGKVTQMDLVLDPYKSIKRFQDAYIFDRKISVARVKNY